MPITEIVRVLAGSTTSDQRRLELLYDVDGTTRPDEQTFGWPRFWIREWTGEQLTTHGPFDDEDEAVEAGDALGARGWRTA